MKNRQLAIIMAREKISKNIARQVLPLLLCMYVHVRKQLLQLVTQQSEDMQHAPDKGISPRFLSRT